MEIGSRLLGQSDSEDNQIIIRVYYDENKLETNATVYLRLKSDKRARLLGNVDFATKTFFCKRSMAKHYHYQVKGFGFNWTILNDSYLNIENIHLLVDDKDRYVFKKDLITRYGNFLNFKQQGFELQKFLKFQLIKDLTSKSC
jgi:hypothetical protein